MVNDALSSSRGTAALSALIAVGGGLVAARFGSAALTMTLGKGTYEFLSAAPGQRGQGGEGLLGVVQVATSTPATPTTAAAPGAPDTETLDCDPIAGAAIVQANRPG